MARADSLPSSTTPLETEIKFDLAPQAATVLRAALAPHDGKARRRTLVSTYFDDAGLSLGAAGLTLRVRVDEGRYVQTVKTEGDGGFSRGEWETPLPGPDLDLEAAARTPARDALAKAGPLRPVFTSRIDREARRLTFHGATIEAAIDRGVVETAAGARSDLAQLELELIDGPAAALFSLAEALAAAAPLRLSFQTKAGLGYDLLKPPGEARKQALALSGAMTAGEAFQAVARSTLRQITANAAIVRAGQAPEAVHQMRVGLRRLRSALGAFKAVVRDPRYEAVKAELKWMTGQLNPVRDLDVFIDETYGPAAEVLGPDPGVAALGAHLHDRQARLHGVLARTLGDRRARDLPLTVAAWVEAGDWLDGEAARQPVTPFAKAILRRADHRLARRGAHLARLEPAERHQARIAAKKLRYALEFFGGLLPAKPARRLTRRLAALQDSLGQLNDIAVARQAEALLGEDPPAAVTYAAGLIVGRRAASEARVLKAAARHFHALEAADRPWRP